MKRFLSFALLYFVTVFGEQGDSAVVFLPEVVVTAERVPHRVRDVAASVSVVTGSELRALGARSATDALALLPGVFIQRTGQFGRTDIDIRGVGAQGTRVAVLVDGRPEKMALFGCTVTHTLPFNNVERIEVVRGPLSVLYGSDALGGVVNIITRQAEAPLQANARLAYGSFNTFQARLGLGSRFRKGDILLSLAKDMSDGHLPNAQYNGNDAVVRGGFRFSPDLKVDLTGKFFTGVKHEPKRVDDPDTLVATGWNRYDRGGVDLTANFTRRVNGFLKLYRNFGEHRFDPKDGWHSTDWTNGALLHLHRGFAFGNLIQAGFEVKRLGGTWLKSDTSRPSWARGQWDIFFEDEQRLGPVLVNAGARFARDNISGNALCPKAGLVVQPARRTAMRASVNKGFRYPPFNYTSIFPPRNPELEPEVTWNYELGWNQHLGGNVEFDIAGFLLKGDNLIELAENPAPPPPFKFQNRGGFIFKGVEFAFSGGLRTVHTRIFATLNDFGIHTRGRPGLKIGGSISGEFFKERLGIGVELQGVDRYYAEDSSKNRLPGFWTADLRCRYRLLERLRIFLNLENLFDRSYRMFADLPGASGVYQMPGRTVTLGVDLGD